jgi:hypothetical protein
MCGCGARKKFQNQILLNIRKMRMQQMKKKTNPKPVGQTTAQVRPLITSQSTPQQNVQPVQNKKKKIQKAIHKINQMRRRRMGPQKSPYQRRFYLRA